MWKEIVTLFRSQGPLQEAYDEAIVMLRASHDMFDHAVKQLHSEGALDTDICVTIFRRTLRSYLLSCRFCIAVVGPRHFE